MDADAELNCSDGAQGWRRYALIGAWVLGFILVDTFFWFRVHWVAGLAFALVAPLALAFVLPRKGMRLLVVGYLAWAVAWLSATFLQGRLAGEGSTSLARSPLLSWLVGSYEMQVVWSAVAGVLIGLAAVGVPLALLVWVAAEGVLALNELPDVSRAEAMRLVLMAVLGLGPPWLVVDEGEVKTSKPRGLLPKLGGPGVVVVQEGNAAIFQKGGRITKVVGPGKANVGFLERVRSALDLRPQWENRTLENVRTRDHIPLTVELGVGFRIEPKEETDQREAAHRAPDGEALTPVLGTVYQVYEGTVRKAAFNPSGDWKLTAVGMVESNLRDVVATYDFDQIFQHEPGERGRERFDSDERVVREIEKEVLERVRKTAAEKFGVSISTVDIRAVSVPEAVQERLLEWWGVRWQGAVARARGRTERDVLALKGEGQAAAFRAVEDERAKSIADTARVLQKVVENLAWRDARLADRLATVLERIIGRMTMEDVLALRMLEALEKISEGKGEVTVFLGGEGIPFLGPPEGRGREPEE